MFFVVSYDWVFPLKDKKGITITNAFQKILKESGKGSEFYNRLMRSWLEKNGIEMYSTHNERNLLLLKDSLQTYIIKCINIWLQFQKMFVLTNMI